MELELTAEELYREISKGIERVKRNAIDDILSDDQVKITEATDQIAEIIGASQYIKSVFHDYIFEGILPEEEEIDEDDTDSDNTDEDLEIDEESDS